MCGILIDRPQFRSRRRPSLQKKAVTSMKWFGPTDHRQAVVELRAARTPAAFNPCDLTPSTAAAGVHSVFASAELRNGSAQLLTQQCTNFARVFHRQRPLSQSLAIGQGHASTQVLDLQHGVGGHAELPQAQTQQQHSEDRIAAHLAAQADFDIRGPGGRNSQLDQPQYSRIGGIVQFGNLFIASVYR